VQQDYEEALHWYSQGADQADAHAQHDLALCHLNGWGTSKDPRKAVQVTHRVPPCPPPHYSPTRPLHWGRLCAGWEWYSFGVFSVAAHRKPHATERRDEFGGPMDHSNAASGGGGGGWGAQWLKRAAEQKLAEAQSHLAQCYVKGVGVGVDAARARELFAAAAAQGDLRAIVGLGYLLRVRSRVWRERVELVDTHGRWKRPCLQTAHMTM
jgi:hypothetical protein